MVERKKPTFSSSLLDSIYRSIGEDDRDYNVKEEDICFYREIRKKQQDDFTANRREQKNKSSEMWKSQRDPNTPFSSVSSSSSSGCNGFSHSEFDPFDSSTSSLYTVFQKPRPIRTKPCVSGPLLKERTKHEVEFTKSKSKSQINYSDVKMMKSSISPGARIASFMNSIFASGKFKKSRVASLIGGEDLYTGKNTQSMCSISSHSKSCLSKTPSTRERPLDQMKRSVRFYPVNVIVDEKYHEQRNLTAITPKEKIDRSESLFKNELRIHLLEKNKKVEAAAKELLREFKRKEDLLVEIIRDIHKNDEENEDDRVSCSSSDLFELENFAASGIDKYSEELPVYETTYLERNIAIAKGLVP